MWLKTGPVAINGWVALSAHYQILAAEANVVASKALAEAQADLVIITNADAAAAMGRTMNGDDIKTAVHAVFIAAPGHACTRTSIKDKAQGLAFLGGLHLH